MWSLAKIWRCWLNTWGEGYEKREKKHGQTYKQLSLHVWLQLRMQSKQPDHYGRDSGSRNIVRRLTQRLQETLGGQQLRLYQHSALISLENVSGGFLGLSWRYLLSFRNFSHLFLHYFSPFLPQLPLFLLWTNSASKLLAFLVVV